MIILQTFDMFRAAWLWNKLTNLNCCHVSCRLFLQISFEHVVQFNLLNAIVDPDNTIFWQDGNFFCSFFDGTINLPCWLLVVLCCSRHLHIRIKVKLWQHCFAIISQPTKAKDYWEWVFYTWPSSVTFRSKK